MPLAFGIEPGIWNLEFGICYLLFGTWNLEFGICYLVFVIWNLEFGPWNFKKLMMKHTLIFFCLLLAFGSCRKTATNPEVLPNTYSDQALGKSANDLLSGSKYTSLNVQIQYMPGYSLDTGTISALSAYLNMLCNKPGGISITQAQIAGNGGDSLTVDQVAVLEVKNRTAYTSGSTLDVYILVTDGYDTAGTVLGFAYRNTSIALMGKAIFDHSGGFGEIGRAALESSVLEHEFGHILGLVNLGTPMQVFHQDTAHGNHCNNANCLMHYSIETNGAFNIFHPATIPVLDSNCRNDLHANGGK